MLLIKILTSRHQQKPAIEYVIEYNTMQYTFITIADRPLRRWHKIQ